MVEHGFHHFCLGSSLDLIHLRTETDNWRKDVWHVCVVKIGEPLIDTGDKTHLLLIFVIFLSLQLTF